MVSTDIRGHEALLHHHQVRACQLDGALGGDPSFEVLERGGLHLVVTEVDLVGGGEDNNKKEFLCCSVFE